MEGQSEDTVMEEGDDYLDDQEDTEAEDSQDYPDDYSDEDWEAEVGGSEPTPLGGIYGLFKDVLKKPDSKKVSNLKNEELGLWSMSVRDCERIALIADTFHHPGVANFFRKQSRIITDTAMSRNGWFSELFITSKRYASRDSSSSVANLPQYNTSQRKKSKWRIFSGKEENQSH